MQLRTVLGQVLGLTAWHTAGEENTFLELCVSHLAWPLPFQVYGQKRSPFSLSCPYSSSLLFLPQLLKTHGIFPHHSYILVCHPHGFMSHSCFGNFATEASGFTKIFPGITPYVLMLGAFFWVPFLRDYAMLTGACSVSQSSMDYLFTQKGTGNMLVVVVSGLVECRYHTLYREALTHAVLEELDWVCMQGPAAWIYPCAFNECGFTENSWGLLPYAQPVTTIVGEPLPVPKIEKPSQEVVDKYHAPCREALHKLTSTRPCWAAQRPRSW
ncbi:Acyl-CoA wax alcohol acyltransferase 2 [Myotis davidii]|uniref:Acyl-CoA wax alcohol acyltransferase 2 n=1 Tax=Myotis davidii TaxID=225400 RepID=L5M2U9_MYODS|nr:Acyl-CoA wax alcohol acyltransferase 2 [Myotis davidii]